MVIGLGLSLLIVVYRASRPRISLLGAHPSAPDAFVDLDGDPEAVAKPGTIILRADQPLWYANALAMREAVLAALAAAPETRAVVLDASSVGLLDVTTSDVLIEVAAQLRTRGVGLWIGGMHPSARDFAERSGLAAALGEDHIQSPSAGRCAPPSRPRAAASAASSKAARSRPSCRSRHPWSPTVPAVRPGASWCVQYRFVCAMT